MTREQLPHMDSNECSTFIAARNPAGRSLEEILQALDAAGREFRAAAQAKFDVRRRCRR